MVRNDWELEVAYKTAREMIYNLNKEIANRFIKSASPIIISGSKWNRNKLDLIVLEIKLAQFKRKKENRKKFLF